MRPYSKKSSTDSEDWQGNRTDGSWRTKGVVNGALTALAGTDGNLSRHAHAIRDELRRHFITQGNVPWQVQQVKD
ncbi:hypothetical protein MRX96_010268 [Rhipicephalus microplus]